VSRPLEDVKILDLTRLLPGGFCTLLLGDLGADVIKVEDTGQGDYVRWAPPYYGDDEHTPLGTRSAIYLALNRNKRSIRLDLKQEGGRQALLKLAESADVLVESFRPGVLDKLGVGYDVLSQANPALVYCPITGYGQDGPNRDRAGHDMNYLGLNGVLGLTGEAGGPPIQSGAQIADLGGGGLMAAVGILAALQDARRSGQGQIVDISMTDGSLAWLAMEAGRYFGSGEVPERGNIMLSVDDAAPVDGVRLEQPDGCLVAARHPRRPSLRRANDPASDPKRRLRRGRRGRPCSGRPAGP
jgi:crotonobetainyl-CoA:carnitine CoA-transferase CaiB-like acyl-CoA transferase